MNWISSPGGPTKLGQLFEICFDYRLQSEESSTEQR